MVARVKDLLAHSLATSTAKVYRRAWVLLIMCFQTLNVIFHGISDLPLSVHKVMLFVGFLHVKKLSSSTMTSYVSAIGYFHRIKGFKDPTTQPVVQKMLAAANKLNPRQDPRLPITLIILKRLVEALPSTVSNPYHRSLFRAMYVVAFFGLMRVGEITKSPTGIVALTLKQLSMTATQAILTISHFKHNVSLKPLDIVLPKQNDSNICPVHLLHEYLLVRGNRPGPLFCFVDGASIPRDFFIKYLKSSLNFCGLDTRRYQSHSFRIGGASLYAELGLSDSQLRLLGRWNSNAFLKYIRLARIQLALQSIM